MATRSTEERLAELDKKLDNIKAQKRALLARANAEERKKRTHRLIQIGAEVEKYCGQISNLEAFAHYVEKYAGAIKRTQAESEQNIADSETNKTFEFESEVKHYE